MSARGKLRQDRVDQLLLDLGRGRHGQLPIRAQHVGGKMLGDEAHLARRRPRGIANQHGSRSASPAPASALSFAPASSSPTRPDEDAARAERGDVARDIAGAADIGLAALDRDDRRRRFRRNARHLAIDEFVEHEVADAEHGLARNRLRSGLQNRTSGLPGAPSAKAIGAIEKTLHVSARPRLPAR